MAPSPDRSAAAPPAREVYSVTRVNREVRALLERGLPVLWVEGELTNFSQPASGHWYFTLKDREAQLRCAMFRMRNALVGFTPSAGAQVLVRGRVSVYEARGEYQLIVEHLEEAGVGALRRECEPAADRVRSRARDRLHHRGFRGRCARADALGGRGARGAGWRGVPPVPRAQRRAPRRRHAPRAARERRALRGHRAAAQARAPGSAPAAADAASR